MALLCRVNILLKLFQKNDVTLWFINIHGATLSITANKFIEEQYFLYNMPHVYARWWPFGPKQHVAGCEKILFKGAFVFVLTELPFKWH
jgi:hypothetical protein